MPVGTRGAIVHLDASDVEALGAQVILANTYHLMMRPGADVVETLGGIHGMADWDGHVLTDSGGYQIFSLGPELSDDGATFKSTYDGSTHLLTPEGAVDVQAKIGADIQMVLDVCPSSIADLSVVRVRSNAPADGRNEVGPPSSTIPTQHAASASSASCKAVLTKRCANSPLAR